jgi:hypothetical protein
MKGFMQHLFSYKQIKQIIVNNDNTALLQNNFSIIIEILPYCNNIYDPNYNGDSDPTYLLQYKKELPLSN